MRSGLDPETYRPGDLFYENVVFGLTGTLGRDAKMFLGDVHSAKDFAANVLAGENVANMYTTELLEDVLGRLRLAVAMVAEAVDIKETRDDR